MVNDHEYIFTTYGKIARTRTATSSLEIQWTSLTTNISGSLSFCIIKRVGGLHLQDGRIWFLKDKRG